MKRLLRPTPDFAPRGVGSVVVWRTGMSRRVGGAVHGLSQPGRAPH